MYYQIYSCIRLEVASYKTKVYSLLGITRNWKTILQDDVSDNHSKFVARKIYPILFYPMPIHPMHFEILPTHPMHSDSSLNAALIRMLMQADNLIPNAVVIVWDQVPAEAWPWPLSMLKHTCNNDCYPGWGPDPNWVMIRPSQAHTRVIPDQNYRVFSEVWAHYGLDHGLEMAWSEVILVWKVWS